MVDVASQFQRTLTEVCRLAELLAPGYAESSDVLRAEQYASNLP